MASRLTQQYINPAPAIPDTRDLRLAAQDKMPA